MSPGVIVIWRWTGYNMIFFLAALQNVDHSTLEAARIDGAGAFKTFWFVTVPQLRPMISRTIILGSAQRGSAYKSGHTFSGVAASVSVSHSRCL